MSCYHPLPALMVDGGVKILPACEQEFDAAGEPQFMELPCGSCIGCKQVRSSSWSVRCYHEAQLYEKNCFLTLTYSDEHLPEHGSLRYYDVQKFLKRFRRGRRGCDPGARGSYPIRFFAAGEYGETSYRAHYHLLVFNFDFPDKYYWRTSESGEKLYRSDSAEALWSVKSSPLGAVEIGSVTPRSAAYVSGYAQKKMSGRYRDFYSWVDTRTGEVCEVKPEFCVMSRKPGLGADWYDRYASDVLPRDYVVVEGRKTKVPRFYSERFKARDPSGFEVIQAKRVAELMKMPLAERQAARREVQEKVAWARAGQKPRRL